MKLLILNGSPRAIGSNSTLLMQHFCEGAKFAVPAFDFEMCYLSKHTHFDEYLEKYDKAENVLWIFPLYVHAMPSIVKDFMEILYTAKPQNKPPHAFIVQSGFTEAAQSRFLEPYLTRFPGKLGCKSNGLLIKGGIEGIQIMPKFATKSLFRNFNNLGQIYAKNDKLDEKLCAKLRKPEHLNSRILLIMRIMAFLKMNNFYWNMQLKKNNAFHLRDSQPYL